MPDKEGWFVDIDTEAGDPRFPWVAVVHASEITGTEEADAVSRLYGLVVDRLEKAEDALEALAGELTRCIEEAPNGDARTAYQWIKSYLFRLPAASFMDQRAVQQKLTESVKNALREVESTP